MSAVTKVRRWICLDN